MGSIRLWTVSVKIQSNPLIPILTGLLLANNYDHCGATEQRSPEDHAADKGKKI